MPSCPNGRVSEVNLLHSVKSVYWMTISRLIRINNDVALMKHNTPYAF